MHDAWSNVLIVRNVRFSTNKKNLKTSAQILPEPFSRPTLGVCVCGKVCRWKFMRVWEMCTPIAIKRKYPRGSFSHRNFHLILKLYLRYFSHVIWFSWKIGYVMTSYHHPYRGIFHGDTFLYFALDTMG